MPTWKPVYADSAEVRSEEHRVHQERVARIISEMPNDTLEDKMNRIRMAWILNRAFKDGARIAPEG